MSDTTPIYRPGDTVFVADRLMPLNRPVAVRRTFVRMQGAKALVTSRRRMYKVDPTRLFKTWTGAMFLGLMEV